MLPLVLSYGRGGLIWQFSLIYVASKENKVPASICGYRDPLLTIPAAQVIFPLCTFAIASPMECTCNFSYIFLM